MSKLCDFAHKLSWCVSDIIVTFPSEKSVGQLQSRMLEGGGENR